MSDSVSYSEAPRYYVPHSSVWPIVGSTALAVTAFGAVSFIHQSTEKVAAEGSFGAPVFYVGLAMIAFKRHQSSQPMPFGPFIAIAGWIALLWGEKIVNAYLISSGF